MELKIFTVEEANALIPRLRVLLGELSAIQQRWNSIQTGETIETIMQGQTPKAPDNWLECSIQHQKEFEELKEAFNDRYLEIQNLGCQLKDVSQGLVDFPSMRDDRIVLLCWKLGESKIGYWHDLDGNYSLRSPL